MGELQKKNWCMQKFKRLYDGWNVLLGVPDDVLVNTGNFVNFSKSETLSGKNWILIVTSLKGLAEAKELQNASYTVFVYGRFYRLLYGADGDASLTELQKYYSDYYYKKGIFQAASVK